MFNFMDSTVVESVNEMENCLDPQLWHACAGGMPQIPPVNSKVYYFPQGHIEHASKKIDSVQLPQISPLFPCRVESIKYLADSESEEVFVKIGLVPLKLNECDVDDESELIGFVKNEEKSFAKTLTQSDANNGGGFSVPRYCAETIFPLLDLKADPPVQNISVKDVRGEEWKFRHIYRGTPRRHLLTTGWSSFVNKKKLVAGDSIVFARAENNDLCVGVRRAKKVYTSVGLESSSGWNTGSFFGTRNVKIGDSRVKGRGNVSAESVLEAASLAVNGKPFEVVYYPCAGVPEFVVRISAVRDAMRVPWTAGMRFKMPFETDDSTRKSLFVGTISNVQVEDPVQWPNSPWRLLQVTWDEPDLLPNLKRVNPWLVELVSSIPTIHHFPFTSLPSKRPRLGQPSVGQIPFFINPLSPSSPLCCLDNISAGIQGARHAQYVLSSPDFKFDLVQTGFDFNYAPELPKIRDGNSSFDAAPLKKETKNEPAFILFGQPIHTQEQMTESSSSDGNKENVGNVSNGSESAVIQNSSQAEASSEEQLSRFKEI